MENTTDFEVAEDVRQSDEYAKNIESIGWEVIRYKTQDARFKIFLRKFLGLRIAKIQRTKDDMPWGVIFKLLKKESVSSLRFEPLVGRKPNGFETSTWPLLGTKTLRVNLRPTTNKILESFKKDCRYYLRKLSVNNYQLTVNNFDDFYEIWRREARRKRLWIPGKKEYNNLLKSFGKKAICLSYQDLAGVVILMHKKTAYYYYSACKPEGKKLQLPYLLVWEAMKIAKKNGCTVWDFEGILDARWPSPGWKGFSHFKKSFGGKEIEFPGSFQKWMWPF